MSGDDDAALQRMMASGRERPVIRVLRAQRILAMLALGLFIVWLAMAFGAFAPERKDAAFVAFAIVLIASIGLKFLARRLDREAMERDLAELEGRGP